MGSGPPNKFVVGCTLTGTAAENATALSNAYASFYATFGLYPTVALIDDANNVYLGAYSD